MRLFGLLAAIVCITAWLRGQGTSAGSPADPERVLASLISTNRPWLENTPPSGGSLAYTFHLIGSEARKLADIDLAKASRTQRQGVAWTSVLHHLSRPGAKVASLTNEGDTLRLALDFSPEVGVACGNGIQNSFRGYFSRKISHAEIVADAATLLPRSVQYETVTESYSEYVARRDGVRVPLKITVETGDMRFDWDFRVHDGGLWLLDSASAGGSRVAWITDVCLDGAHPAAVIASPQAVQAASARDAGAARLRAVIATNRHWLAPPITNRLGVAYEYRQEPPHREQVYFDPEGHVLVQLASSKEKPGQVTRQVLWLASGRKVQAQPGDPYAQLEPCTSPLSAEKPLERRLRNLFFGLGIDCAVFALGRNPEAFAAHRLASDVASGQEIIELEAVEDARLFTGTMLYFTSNAYMHDVRYTRSELIIDRATDQLIEERDYDRSGRLVGHYWFDAYTVSPPGAEPGPAFPLRIKALIPYERDQDEDALEMEARFAFTGAGVWLLDRVQSRFRREASGSAGTLTVVPPAGADNTALRELEELARRTEVAVQAVNQAPIGVRKQIMSGGWRDFPLQAAWAEGVSPAGEKDEQASRARIGVLRAQLDGAGDDKTVTLEGLSTALWKDYETRWEATVTDPGGERFRGAATVKIRAEAAPAPFSVTIPLKAVGSRGSDLCTVEVSGRVQRLTAAYHGHGVWMRFGAEP